MWYEKETEVTYLMKVMNRGTFVFFALLKSCVLDHLRLKPFIIAVVDKTEDMIVRIKRETMG